MKLKTQNAKLKTRYNFLPDIATADLAFEAFGKNPSELFENAALALEESMVKLDNVAPSNTNTINKEEDSLENLLFSFLEELIYLKDAEQLIFSKIECEVKSQDTKRFTLNAHLSGEKIDPNKHKLGIDVKAVTKHLFKIEQLSNKIFRAQVILDV